MNKDFKKGDYLSLLEIASFSLNGILNARVRVGDQTLIARSMNTIHWPLHRLREIRTKLQHLSLHHCVEVGREEGLTTRVATRGHA